MPRIERIFLLCTMVLFSLSFLIDSAVGANIPGKKYNENLFYAYARMGSLEELEKYLEEYTADIQPAQYTIALAYALEAAKEQGAMTKAEFLLKKGAPLDLGRALQKGITPEILQWFLDAGADVRPKEGPSPIFSLDPAQDHTPELLAKLLKAGADPNAELPFEAEVSDGIRDTPLTHVIGQDGPALLVELLLKAGADPNRRSLMFSPLNLAVIRNRPDICGLLLKAGAAPECAISTAIHNNNTELIELFFLHGLSVKEGGGYLLLGAAQSASPGVTKRLLEAGAVPDELDQMGKTPLDIAEGRSNIQEREELCALLRAAGTPSGREIREKFYAAAEQGSPKELAALFRENKACLNPLTIRQALLLAVEASRDLDRLKVVEWFLAQGETLSPEVILSRDASPQILQLLVRAGAEVRTINDIPSLFLLQWDKPNAPGLAKVLIEAGADPNALSPPKIPFFLELFKGSPAAILFLPLVEAAAEKDVPQPPLVHAVIRGGEDCIEVLLDNGADIAAKDKLGFDALFYAVSSGRADNLLVLLKKGANPNGKGVLEAAALSDPNLVQILLNNGAEAGSDEGFKALRRAVMEGPPESVKILLKAGADFRRKDAWGKSLIEVARNRKNFFRQTPEGKAIESLLRTAGI